MDRDAETYATVADADRRADEMAARILGCVLVLDEPNGKHEASLLRDAVTARPPALPRLAPLLAAIEAEKRGQAQKAAAAQARSMDMRAAAEGRAVTGRMELSDAERESVARRAAHRSGRKVQEEKAGQAINDN